SVTSSCSGLNSGADFESLRRQTCFGAHSVKKPTGKGGLFSQLCCAVFLLPLPRSCSASIDPLDQLISHL
ncbi:MAG: hypothetical protein AAGL97_17060, partial [Pseudomonadota bacterium]